jgi:hypothetical protein
MLLLALVLSQTVNPYAGVQWKGQLPGLDAELAKRIGARLIKSDAVKPAPRAPLTATDFKSAGPRSAAETLIASSKVGKAQGEALVEGLNAGLDAFERETRKNNVAYALAFLLGSAKQATTDRDVSDTDTERLAQAINDELAASPAFKKLTDKQRQLLYENGIVVGALIGGLSAEAVEARDAQAKAQARQLASQALICFGLSTGN